MIIRINSVHFYSCLLNKYISVHCVYRLIVKSIYKCSVIIWQNTFVMSYICRFVMYRCPLLAGKSNMVSFVFIVRAKLNLLKIVATNSGAESLQTEWVFDAIHKRCYGFLSLVFSVSSLCKGLLTVIG